MYIIREQTVGYTGLVEHVPHYSNLQDARRRLQSIINRYELCGCEASWEKGKRAAILSRAGSTHKWRYTIDGPYTLTHDIIRSSKKIRRTR